MMDMGCYKCKDEQAVAVHAAAPAYPGGPIEYACEKCYAAIMEAGRAAASAYVAAPCEGCGAAYGAGCDCPENLRAIARGENAKAKAEEGSA